MCGRRLVILACDMLTGVDGEMVCRLLAIAEETLTEFLAKATGTAVDWIQLPGMKVSDGGARDVCERVDVACSC